MTLKQISLIEISFALNIIRNNSTDSTYSEFIDITKQI